MIFTLLTETLKIMPIADPAHHIGIENLYITQPMPGLSVSDGWVFSVISGRGSDLELDPQQHRITAIWLPNPR